MNAFTYNMPAGIPGVANRLGGRMPEIEAVTMDPTNPLPFYGLAGKIDAASQCLRTLANGDAAGVVYGFLVRPYPTQPTVAAGYSGSVALGSPAVPPQTQVPVDVMKSGRMTCQLANPGTAAVKGGTVYVYLQNPPVGFSVGSVTALNDAGNVVALDAKSYFMGGADSNGNVEIAFNI